MNNIEIIYKEYFETVYKYLVCLTGDNHVAEELTQETFFRAIMKIHTFKGKSKISTWLCQIAKNLWYNELKRNKRINNLKGDILESIPSYENIEENIILEEEKKYFYEKIKQLNSITQKVMYLRLNGKLTFKEIGDILGKSENWARITFYRGKNIIKEE